MVLFLNLDGGCQVVSTEIIDDDAFPGNKHREEIEKGEDAIWNISGFSLFWEFFRLNFIRNSDHHWRIIGESLANHWCQLMMLLGLSVHLGVIGITPAET